jgi:light-regulated signal transduction histidine kinase (bacteriophytochrome)
MQSYRAIGEYEKAIKHYDRYYLLEKEMTGQQTQREIAELNYQYESALKEKEAQMLKEKNEAINIYAQKLEISNNELKQFANVASHDLREPLRMVTSYMQLLEQTMGEEIKPVQKQFIGFAIDGAKRMEQLIHDLLRLAKVDANPQIERVSLPSVVDAIGNRSEVWFDGGVRSGQDVIKALALGARGVSGARVSAPPAPWCCCCCCCCCARHQR